MKHICTKCKLPKSDEEFHLRNSDQHTRQVICKSCRSEYSRLYHLANRKKHLAQAKSYAKKLAREKRDIIMEYLDFHPCVDCGEEDPVVLEFDHEDRSKKRIAISKMLGKNYSLESLREEISKCSVRCANCHRRKTARQFGSYRCSTSRT